MAGHDALFHPPGSLLVVLEECFVVVALNKEGVNAAEGVHHLSSRVAEVGGDCKRCGSVRDDKPNGIRGIVGDREGSDAEVAEIE